ncbi:hypothetical protein PAHAL_2G036400 [Panicum hallii]|uniref:Phytocyanin domain-containing protein n=1 Tax=Panicum hallii TaxID=206008 RepID=A0A2S3GW79_9POAL|nr:stellacyanin-like [Panicum hallii]PAN09601.1 hypothetical protein PAHAL_2G036400 [Panicum hallii]
MASKSLLIVAVAVLFAAAPALAADLVVGDDKGWDLEVDYDEWVDGNQFIVGDRLVFKYTKGNHSVVEATAAGFAACSDANSLATWSSGDDRVPLSGSGQRWFFSGVGKDCGQGMRFNVTVLPVVKLSPSASPPPPPPSSAPSGGRVAPALAAAAVAAAALLF